MTRHCITIGKDRFVLGPWHDDPDTAYVALAPSSSSVITSGSVAQCLEIVAAKGFSRAVTAALRPSDAHAFHGAGFTDRESLVVLRHDLNGPLLTGPRSRSRHIDHTFRRGRTTDRDEVLALDQLAFEAFWYLGSDGLHEALTATPRRRYRIAVHAETHAVGGYAVCGRSADIGYLQRLAVHPDHLRKGLGVELVLDALRWLKRRRTHMMLVNTQESNQPARALYRHLGFNAVDDRLTVMMWQKS